MCLIDIELLETVALVGLKGLEGSQRLLLKEEGLAHFGAALVFTMVNSNPATSKIFVEKILPSLRSSLLENLASFRDQSLESYTYW